jgi:site-specific DNA recombinase
VLSTALYARVSSERQKDEQTIASQVEALRAFAEARGCSVTDDYVFTDDG